MSLQQAIAAFKSSCPDCYRAIEVGDSITKTGGRWVHDECLERSKEHVRITKLAKEAHRASLERGEMQYSVCYSVGTAMGWALEHKVIAQDEYDMVHKSRTYSMIAEAAVELGCGTSNIHRLIKQLDLKKQKKKVVRVEKVVRRVNVNHIDIDELIRLRGE